MGNSASLGQGRTEAHDQRDMEDGEIKDGRPPMEVQLAEEKPMEDPSNQNPPQWRPERGTEEPRVEKKCPDHGLRRERKDHGLGANQNFQYWHPSCGADETRVDVERPIVDGRTAEKTYGPNEFHRDNGITQLTPIMRRRGLRDDDEAYLTRSHALNKGYYQDPPQCPQWLYEIDQGQSPDMFSTPPRRDSAYYTAATDRVRTRGTSSRPREQRTKSNSKRTKSEREDGSDAKAGQTIGGARP